MPRRNRARERHRPLVMVLPTRKPTTDDLARDLVARGLASPRILGGQGPPKHTSTKGDTA